LKVLGCDRKCESCPLLELYEGLEQYGVKGYRCPMAGCELKAPALKRISEKVKELFLGVEWGGDLERIRKMLGRKKSE